MTSFAKEDRMVDRACNGLVGRLLRLALSFALGVTVLAAGAAEGGLSEQDQQCLGCHGTRGMDMKMANGETLALYVEGKTFSKSVHHLLGCAVCHRDIATDKHPPLKKKVPSLRDNSVELAKVCRTCHGGIAKQFEGSIHAALLRKGDPSAPLCTDCHDPHATMAKAAFNAKTGAPCSACHSPVFKAFAESVHGQSGIACANCHSAHEVSPVAAESKLKTACFGCHPDSLAAHQSWLPNAARHFESVACTACHVPGAKRRIDLRLYNNALQERVAETEGVPRFEARARSADPKGVGLDAMALHGLLREFNREGDAQKTTLRGRLEVTPGLEAHRLGRKSDAIQDCAKCHRQGADPFQSVTVSIVGPDGRTVRYDAQKEVLNSILSVDAVGGFYAIGATRIQWLDVLLILAFLGGCGVPIGHLTLNWLFKRYAKRISGREDS